MTRRDARFIQLTMEEAKKSSVGMQHARLQHTSRQRGLPGTPMNEKALLHVFTGVSVGQQQRTAVIDGFYLVSAVKCVRVFV
jgi:hypothetical protein